MEWPCGSVGLFFRFELVMVSGKQIETIDRTAFGLPTLHADMGWKESCDDYLDNLTSLFKNFNDVGYTVSVFTGSLEILVPDLPGRRLGSRSSQLAQLLWV